MEGRIARILGSACCLLVAASVPATATVREVESDELDSGTSGVDLFDSVSWGGTSVGGNPLAECLIEAEMEAWEVTESIGATGVDLGLDTVIRDADEGTLFAFMSCRGDDGTADWFVWAHGDPVPEKLGHALARSARALVRVPVIEPVTAPDGFEVPFLTQLPVWLWVDDVAWSTQSSTAAITEFGISATVTATPVGSTWLVDGELVADSAQGEVWRPGRDDGESSCLVSFGEVFEGELSVVVTYDVSLACVPASMCAGLELDPIHGIAVRPVRAVEMWGVVTG